MTVVILMLKLYVKQPFFPPSFPFPLCPVYLHPPCDITLLCIVTHFTCLFLFFSLFISWRGRGCVDPYDQRLQPISYSDASKSEIQCASQSNGRHAQSNVITTQFKRDLRRTNVFTSNPRCATVHSTWHKT